MILSLQEKMESSNAKFLVVLDTMWGGKGISPSWFPINQYNHSGKRLYQLTNSRFPQVWVTNCCPEVVPNAKSHGKPSVEWLKSNLNLLTTSLKRLPLLIGGQIAASTYAKVSWHHEGPVFLLPHPAARNWTKVLIKEVKQQIVDKCIAQFIFVDSTGKR